MHEDQSYKNVTHPSVLITGGSGLAGRYLTSLLLEHGYRVAHLSRRISQFGTVRVFRWNPEKKILDPVVFDGIDYVIHLAGANTGDSRWTVERKKEIVSSRVESAMLLHKVITENKITIKAFISASAVGYYGAVTSDNIFNENDPPSSDFMGTVGKLWEDSADLFQRSGIRTVKIRTSLILEKTNNALTKMLMTGKLGFLVRAGSGKQYLPWIHITDLCNIYLKAIEDETMNGPYNAVSPQYTTHNEFVNELGRLLNKKVMTVPSFTVSVMFGEMSDVVLHGSRISSKKLIDSGYVYVFNDLHKALEDIFSDHI